MLLTTSSLQHLENINTKFYPNYGYVSFLDSCLLRQKKKNFNPLTPGAFCQKIVFWTFWWFSGWISAKLASIWSKRHLQHSSLPFLPLASRFTTFWLGHAQKSKFWTRKWPTSLGFLIFEFFFFSFFYFTFFAAVIGLLLGLLAVKKLLRKPHRDGLCSGRNLCSEFFTQFFEHFCAYLSLH